ncbi:MAG: FAD-dependent oxidoreductase [Bacteroidota bacterium]
MSDKFSPLPLPQLVRMVLAGISQKRFQGIPASLFFVPSPDDPFTIERYDTSLASPLGVAAGPHTQMALNIAASWLCGARYIELKTVQTLDELEVSKPCIDMQDEGYNCEWSQELMVDQSFREYLHAWILIHILHRELGFSGPVGTLFNMSVGYDLQGIMNRNVQGFFENMNDSQEALIKAIDSIRGIYPVIDELRIPACISNSVTLSTMHGCPPGEIEKIGLYLIREKKLHTTIKLNPTLLGPESLRGLLNDKLGFHSQVPDEAFSHDLKYPDALKIIDSLSKASHTERLQFSIKLTNTLESLNHKSIFSKHEKMMYMSGRALHPVSISLARKLQNDFAGKLDISFSAGVDCFNISHVVSCGMGPVTVCSDLLKPGGYGRLWQYTDQLRSDFKLLKAGTIGEFILHTAGDDRFTARESALANLNRYADEIARNPLYHKLNFREPDIKTSRALSWFDCIHAPCTDTCPTSQDIPGYMFQTANGNFRHALDVIFDTNPFPSVTGMVCDHLCQLKCTRINYDESLNIREIKRFVAERTLPASLNLSPEKSNSGLTAAVIGAGPAGLSCGWFLNQAGFRVSVFEQKKIAGGMVSAAIPAFRLTGEAVERDIQHILAGGVILHDEYPVDKTNFEQIRADHNVVFIAAGAQRSVALNIDGIGSDGVLDPLEFLMAVKNGNKTGLGQHVVIIGGGNTAMDAARTAYRLVGASGKVTVAYRQTRREMPADQGEIMAVREEGIEILELVNPERVKTKNGRVVALSCSRNTLVLQGNLTGFDDGRPVPVKIPDSEFEISCDTIIPAIGQHAVIDFLNPASLVTQPGSYKTQIPGIYIGGDAMRGASTAINAIADGRKAALEIVTGLCDQNTGSSFQSLSGFFTPESNQVESKVEKLRQQEGFAELMHKRSLRHFGPAPLEIPLDDRQNFKLVTACYTMEEAQQEASRCLYCDEICNTCVTVCPNFANFSYSIEPVRYRLQKAVIRTNGSIAFEEDGDFYVDQLYQILNIRDLCNECGNCTTFCPSAGRPFKDKPGLSLSTESFNREEEGFFLSHLPEKDILIYKEQGRIKTLYQNDGKYYFETGQVKATLDAATFAPQEVIFLTPCIREFHFTFAAEMSIILKGAQQINY